MTRPFRVWSPASTQSIPDIKVTVEYLDYTNGDDQVNTAIEGGSAPDLIMEGPERLVANWGAKGRYGSAERPVDRRRQEGHLRPWVRLQERLPATTTSIPCA